MMTDAGGSPAPGGAGLLIIDIINDMSFEGAHALLAQAMPCAETILDLRGQADRLGVPVIYVNDNYGEWRSERSEIVEHALRGPGADMVRRLAPRPGDYFVIKPQVSGFYATTLPVLLPRLGVRRLVLTGVAADICVLFTAADAHMRAYQLWAPQDAVASSETTHRDWALQIMRKSMGATTAPSSELKLEHFVRDDPGPPDGGRIPA